MRASKVWTAGVVLTLTLVASSRVSAHVRDEYLQAARIALHPDAIEVDLDLTPGMAVAESFLSTIDRDRDGALSTNEQHRYADQAVSGLVFALDGKPLPMRLISVTFPDAEAFRRGEGTIRFRARADVPNVAVGSHQLLFRNRHLPGHSAYLANALAPESARVAVKAQRRLSDQSESTIEYVLRADPVLLRSAFVVSLAIAAILIVPAARRFRAT